MIIRSLSMKKRITVGAEIRFLEERCSNLSNLLKKILLHSFRESNKKVTRKNCLVAEDGGRKERISMKKFLFAVSFLLGMTGGKHYGYN